MQTSMKQLKKDRNSLKESYLPKKKAYVIVMKTVSHLSRWAPFFALLSRYRKIITIDRKIPWISNLSQAVSICI